MASKYSELNYVSPSNQNSSKKPPFTNFTKRNKRYKKNRKNNLVDLSVKASNNIKTQRPPCQNVKCLNYGSNHLFNCQLNNNTSSCADSKRIRLKY